MRSARDQEIIHGHIRALASRSPSDVDTMLEMLRRGCWPTGSDDRIDPSMRESLRRARRARTSADRPNE